MSMRIAAVLAIVIAAGLYMRSGQRNQRGRVIELPDVPIQQASLELRGRSETEFLAVHVDQQASNEEPVDVIWLYRLTPSQPERGGPPQSLIQVPRKEKQS